MTRRSEPAEVPSAVVPWGDGPVITNSGVVGLPSGIVLRMTRVEARESAHFRRGPYDGCGCDGCLQRGDLIEREERVERRRNGGFAMAMSHAVSNGSGFDPSKPWANWPTSEQWAEMVFASQDRADRVQVHRAMVEAGLAGSLGPADAVLGRGHPFGAGRGRVIGSSREARTAVGSDRPEQDSGLLHPTPRPASRPAP